MAAGKRVHVISIEGRSDTVDEAGTPATAWAVKAQVRAEISEQSTEEFQRNFGASDETSIIFRTLHLETVATEDRVKFRGQSYDIRQVIHLGRRRGTELRCVAISGVI